MNNFNKDGLVTSLQVSSLYNVPITPLFNPGG